MDLYPDAMYAHGMARKTGWGYRFLRGLTRFQFSGAGTVLSLGPMMATHVGAYAKKDGAGSMGWVPLWSDPDIFPWPRDQSNPLRAERLWGESEMVLLYSGNMGLGHRFTEFLEASRRLGSSGPRWVFSGGGKRRAEIETFARTNPEARIEFLNYVRPNLLRAHLGAGDVHLASLDSAWQGLIVPSKIQASFAAARPVLFVGGRQCETAVWIEESGGGWIVDEDDLDGLLTAIEQAQDPQERLRRGAAAFEFARQYFQMSENCQEIVLRLENGAFSRF